jgi:hypothetical protein
MTTTITLKYSPESILCKLRWALFNGKKKEVVAPKPRDIDPPGGRPKGPTEMCLWYMQMIRDFEKDGLKTWEIGQVLGIDLKEVCRLKRVDRIINKAGMET